MVCRSRADTALTFTWHRSRHTTGGYAFAVLMVLLMTPILLSSSATAQEARPTGEPSSG